jgi:osmoprotectant transport system ATP-binding protein
MTFAEHAPELNRVRTMIDYLGVSKSYPSKHGPVAAVEHVDLRVETGELCVLLGPSGCGKTTLLRMTNRLIEPSGGRIMIDGRDTASEDPVLLRRRIGYVIQGIGLFPHRTVAENISTTLELNGIPRDRHAARVDELLELMQLPAGRYRNRYPSELSGGEGQRVGVARALAADPPLLLMDEPFGALDPINRSEIQQVLLDLQQRLKKTIVFVSHDIAEALLLADRIVLMRKGRIVQQGHPAELVAAPADQFVADFLGHDRSLLLLDSLRALDAVEDRAAADNLERIAASAPLRDVLLAILALPEGRMAVTGESGEPVGTVSIASIHRKMAELLGAAQEVR